MNDDNSKHQGWNGGPFLLALLLIMASVLLVALSQLTQGFDLTAFL